MRSLGLFGVLSWSILTTPTVGAPPEAMKKPPIVEKGTVQFQLVGDQKTIPERYRLGPHSFDYEMDLKLSLPTSGLEVFRVRFPSPVETETLANNTVHGEYYRPKGTGPFPCVIVLDITGGDQKVSRTIATHLAQNRIAAFFVQMAYYGPRRPPGSRLRLLTPHYEHSMAAVRQTVLDLRRATAWMGARSEVDPKRLGILGTSLGSFMGTLAAEMEPRLSRVANLLGGGGLVDAYYDDPRAAPFRLTWQAIGGTREMMARLIAPADPLTCAANLKDRKVLLLSAKRDEIVPPQMALALWKATGEQKIVWFDCTHYGAVLYFIQAMGHIVEHFRAE